VIIGNPPWNVRDVTALLNRAHSLLPDETGTCGLILPAHRLSYSGPVLELAKLWSIQQTLLPKSLFPRLSLPVVFAHFRKERVRTMVGFFLFEEADAIKGMQASIKTLLATGKQRVGLWRAVVEESLHAIGRRAQLSQIYAYVEGRRPRPIPTWRDTIRRVLQEGPFVRFPDGTWALTGA
jgi:site-specific DNA-methyltransferase (adenine-specific)